MKKLCPRCSCFAEPIKEDHCEYCVMCDWEVTTPYKKAECECDNNNSRFIHEHGCCEHCFYIGGN